MSETPSPGEDRRLFVAASPHLRDRDSIASVMRWVVLALLPAVAVSLWFFGLEAARVYLWAVAGCLAVEWACLRWLKTPGSLRDGSALVTGLLLAMNLPPTTPWWMVLAGAVVAIFLAKHVFGGLGSNLFNPALTARVFLLVAWPAQMTTWLRPGVRGFVDTASLDAMTGATPLGLLKEGRLSEISASSMDLFLGQVGGSLGEISALALLAGGVLLLVRRVITWEIPVAFLGTVALVTGAAWALGGPQYGTPWFHLVSGGLFLGAFFMATDMVTSPMTFGGRLVFGAGCGLLTAVIRLWGGYPEGVSFAILLMNAATPLIDRRIPAPFGRRAPKAKEAA
ncbi:RnfABCDGE type electron transport complex subunit D [Myxococcota bacterium]|nr:RnfABCDGE type electron transport complex subunit D [Myxococcota bacterium]